MGLSLRCVPHYVTLCHCPNLAQTSVFQCIYQIVLSAFPFFLVPCQLAESHYNLSLLRQCAQGWYQSVKASQSDKQASADQLYQHFLLQRSLNCWKKVCIHKRTIAHI